MDLKSVVEPNILAVDVEKSAVELIFRAQKLAVEKYRQLNKRLPSTYNCT